MVKQGSLAGSVRPQFLRIPTDDVSHRTGDRYHATIRNLAPATLCDITITSVSGDGVPGGSDSLKVTTNALSKLLLWNTPCPYLCVIRTACMLTGCVLHCSLLASLLSNYALSNWYKCNCIHLDPKYTTLIIINSTKKGIRFRLIHIPYFL